MIGSLHLHWCSASIQEMSERCDTISFSELTIVIEMKKRKQITGNKTVNLADTPTDDMIRSAAGHLSCDRWRATVYLHSVQDSPVNARHLCYEIMLLPKHNLKPH